MYIYSSIYLHFYIHHHSYNKDFFFFFMFDGMVGAQKKLTYNCGIGSKSISLVDRPEHRVRVELTICVLRIAEVEICTSVAEWQ